MNNTYNYVALDYEEILIICIHKKVITHIETIKKEIKNKKRKIETESKPIYQVIDRGLDKDWGAHLKDITNEKEFKKLSDLINKTGIDLNNYKITLLFKPYKERKEKILTELQELERFYNELITLNTHKEKEI